MKTILSLVSSGLFLTVISGCEIYAEGPIYDPPQETVTYGVSDLYPEGVDDHGNMWIAIEGSFSDYGSSVQMYCDGQNIYPSVISDSNKLIEVSVAAVTYYSNCNVTVFTDGVTLPTVSTPMTPMDFTDSSVKLDGNPSKLDVTLYGDFFVQNLVQSQLTAVASCNGGAYFYPHMLYVSPTKIVVSIANPGSGYREQCDFVIQDTFQDHGNNVTVSSPDYTRSITGL